MRIFERIQNIGIVNGSGNIFINGDAILDKEILTNVAKQLLHDEFERLTAEAKSLMSAEVNECVKSVLEGMMRNHLSDKLSEFSKPSTQFAFYATLKGYSMSETVVQRELLVDAFIERIQAEWDSSEKMIVDTALDVLPKLSPQVLSTLGLLQLRHLLMSADAGFMLENYFKSMSDMAEKMSQVDVLDIEYLKQMGLVMPLPGMQSYMSMERFMLHQYDLFFRHPLTHEEYKKYCNEHPEANHAVMDDFHNACMMWADGMQNNEMHFRYVNSKFFERLLKERHQEYLLQHVDQLMKKMPPFTDEEVRDYFVRFTPSWEKLFKMFSTDSFLHYDLSITGRYIGGKTLAKICHVVALPLSDYKKTIVL